MDDNKHTNDRLGDMVDHADAAYQVGLEAKIREIVSIPIVMENPSQQCWHCGNQTPTQKHRWCNADCRDDWEAGND